MTDKRSISYILYYCLLITLAIGGGCATHSPEERGLSLSSEERLTTRVNQLMQAQIDGEWGIVYDILDSDYRKEVLKKKFVKQGREIDISKYSIEKIEIAPDQKTAKVAIRSDFSMRGYQFTNTLSTHRWIFEDGDWYNATVLLKTIFNKTKQ